MGNTDAHLKNWTLRYPDQRTPRLSPAYDLVSVTSYPEFKDDLLAFALGGNKNPSFVTTDHFRRLASSMSIDEDAAADLAAATALKLADTWNKVRKDCPLPTFIAKHIDDRLRTLPLLV